ncbi:MAG: hypothetical protein JW795_24045 [Chitinivibrionales bacterium]|nr:hypothetical protein [Chitinivibrionales bacterium]
MQTHEAIKIALIGDIVKSRSIMDRLRFQNGLKEVLKALNDRTRGVDSPYTLTIGDEFQALFNSAHWLLDDILRIVTAIYPIRSRFSFGFGLITTAINPVQALEMDGPAFHHAREGMDDLKKKSVRSDRRVCLNGIDSALPYAPLVQSSLTLFFHQIEGMSKNVLQTLHFLLHEQQPQQIAEVLDISVQAVYRLIRRHDLHACVTFIRDVETILNTILEQR